MWVRKSFVPHIQFLINGLHWYEINMPFLVIQPRRRDKEGRINEMINVARDVISRMQAQATQYKRLTIFHRFRYSIHFLPTASLVFFQWRKHDRSSSCNHQQQQWSPPLIFSSAHNPPPPLQLKWGENHKPTVRKRENWNSIVFRCISVTDSCILSPLVR